MKVPNDHSDTLLHANTRTSPTPPSFDVYSTQADIHGRSCSYLLCTLTCLRIGSSRGNNESFLMCIDTDNASEFRDHRGLLRVAHQLHIVCPCIIVSIFSVRLVTLLSPFSPRPRS